MEHVGSWGSPPQPQPPSGRAPHLSSGLTSMWSNTEQPGGQGNRLTAGSRGREGSLQVRGGEGIGWAAFLGWGVV